MMKKFAFKLLLLALLTSLLSLIFVSCADSATEAPRALITIDIDTAEYSENGIIKLTMHNNSTGSFSYNENYALFRYKDGKWNLVPFIDTAFHEVTRTLAASDSTRNNINLDVRHGELLAGKYLLVREGTISTLYSTDKGIVEHINTASASAVFEITEVSETEE